jgi:hypothetical protein
MDPESEVAIWCSITAAWLAYHQEYHGNTLLLESDERALIAALLVISTGCDNFEKFGVPVAIGKRLLKCYNELWEIELNASRTGQRSRTCGIL